MLDKVIMADVHSNLTALKTVLEQVDPTDGTEFYCLGDVVGYGPEPNACINRLRSLDAHVLAGNHDAAACGRLTTQYFNPFARQAVEWTTRELTAENRRYLENRPDRIQTSPFAFYHGSPLEPLTEYITGTHQAEQAVRKAPEPIVAVGHTHQPILFRRSDGRFQPREVSGNHREQGVPTDEPLVLNPGSVGQPRDGDPRAGYVRIEETPESLNIHWKRVNYDVESVQEKIRRHELPEKLASRLAQGR